MNPYHYRDGGLEPEAPSGIAGLLEGLTFQGDAGDAGTEPLHRAALMGLRGAGKSTLLNRLLGWSVSPVAGQEASADSTMAPDDTALPGRIAREDLGVFLLVDLARGGPQPGNAWSTEMGPGLHVDLPPWESTELTGMVPADLILFLVDGAHYVSGDDGDGDARACAQMAEYQWYCRARALRRPLHVILNKADILGDEAPAVVQLLEQRLATKVTAISAAGEDDPLQRLTPALLNSQPDLMVALGREIPALRRPAAARLIHHATVVTGLAGLQPLPLLEIPVLLTAQTRLLRRLAELYGQPHFSGGSREVLAATGGSVGMRLVIQQVVKLVPVIGWLVSGLLSGLSTWLLGWGAVATFNGSVGEQLERLRTLQQRESEQLGPHLRGLGQRARAVRPHVPRLATRRKEVSS